MLLDHGGIVARVDAYNEYQSTVDEQCDKLSLNWIWWAVIGGVSATQTLQSEISLAIYLE